MKLRAKLAILAGFGVIGFGSLLLHEDSEARKAYLKLHPPVECHVCHCHKQFCVRECSEETMCSMRCEGLCQKKADEDQSTVPY